MTRILPWRRMILHLSHIFLTEGRTFISLSFRYADRSIRARPAAGDCFLSCNPHAKDPGLRGSVRPIGPFGELLEAIGDAAAVEVVDRQLHRNSVAGQDLDVVHAHLAGNVGENGMTVLEFHLEHRVGQGFEHRALEFDYIFLSQKSLLQAV